MIREHCKLIGGLNNILYIANKNPLMQLPRFILGDHSDHPEDIFIVHTVYPRFIINLKDDELEFLEPISKEDRSELEEETAKLIQEATAFYDAEIEKYRSDA